MSAIGKIFGYAAKVVKKAPKQNIIAKVESNTAGRILRMQNAKQAFTVGKNYEVVPAKVYKKPANIKLETTDDFSKRIAQMYPESKTGALEYEKLSAKEKIEILKKRADVRAAFEKYTKPQSSNLVKIQNEFAKITKKTKFDGHKLKEKLLETSDLNNIKKISMEDYKSFKLDIPKYLRNKTAN